MVKRLTNKVKEEFRKVKGKFRKGVCLVATLLSLYGCPVPTPIPEPKNQKPTAFVYAVPDSGVSPLSSQLQVDGTDPDGKSDIKEYRMEIDRNADGDIDETIAQQTPINITRNFNDNAIIYGYVKDSAGHIDKKSKNINVSQPDYIDISGRLEDNETDTGQQGVIRFYDATDETFLGECQTDSDGNFSITIDKLVEELPEGVIVQARIGSPENYTSYVRTVKHDINAEAEPDVIVDPIRCVPYPDFDNDGTPDNISEFKQHMYDTNCTLSLIHI